MNNLSKKINDPDFKNEYTLKLLKAEDHFNNIYKACSYSFEQGCGSYLFDGQSYCYQIETYSKQKLLYETSKNKENILEIGTYMGHSLLIMLVANPNAKITTIDINDRYSMPAVNYLKKEFPNAQINFIKGNSFEVLKNLKEKFDLIHIDGTHKNKFVTKEFYKCMNLIKNDEIDFIFDDVDNVKVLIKNILTTYSIKEKYSPTCVFKNLHLKISFPKSKILFFIKKCTFIIKNLLSYTFLKIVKLSKFKKI